MRIPLSKPYLNEDLKRGVLEVLDSGYWTEGAVTREFEELCRRHIGCAHALAVCNCSLGLEMALRALGIGPGDEVVVAPADAMHPGAGPWHGIGTGFGAQEGALRDRFADVLASVEPGGLPRAGDVARLAALAFSRGEAVAPERAEPAYLRNNVALTLVEQQALRTR